jgi:hypothetical protein
MDMAGLRLGKWRGGPMRECYGSAGAALRRSSPENGLAKHGFNTVSALIQAKVCSAAAMCEPKEIASTLNRAWTRRNAAAAACPGRAHATRFVTRAIDATLCGGSHCDKFRLSAAFECAATALGRCSRRGSFEGNGRIDGIGSTFSSTLARDLLTVA